MRKIFNILALAIVAVMYVACDEVNENDRFSEAKNLLEDRKVLVQEFTGQLCPNCPLGHEALDNIAKQYGKNAVIVSIHAGDMAFDDPDFGLKTPDGDAYAKEWGIQQYPSAIVNRKGVMADRSQWQGAVFTALSTSSSVKIDLAAQLAGGEINITSKLESTINAISAKYQLWVIEDNITAMQQDGEEYIFEYIHNHVYRASVNGIGGESIALVPSEAKEMKHSVSVDRKWNTNNLKIVAFIYTDSDVLQAEEVELGK